MTGTPLSRRLRAGLDPNDSFWAVLRYPSDWAAAQGQGAAWDPARGGLTLAPLPRPELADDWLPLAPVAGPDGGLYRADPETGLILRKLPCAADFLPLPGIGGTGTTTGRFRTPAGLAFDGRGRLYIADPGNARVQIADPATGTVIAVLEAGLSLPVHAAIADDGTIFIADAGIGAVQVFSPRFQPCGALPPATRDPLTGALWADDPPPRPLAITVLADGTLAMFDPLRAMLWHMSRTGQALPALGWFDDDQLPAGWSPTPRRHTAEAELRLGPIDGGIHDLAWHRLEFEADLPPGTALQVQTHAGNDPDDPLRAWAPETPVALPQLITDRAEGGMDRLIRADQSLWALWRAGRLTRTTPAIARLEGDGPGGTASFLLPPDQAAGLRPGDTLRLQNPAGDEITAEIAAITASNWTVAAQGAAALLANPPRLMLIERAGAPLPHGPADLGFLAAPLPALTLSGGRRRPTLALPAQLAGIVMPGDVLEIAGADDRARIELIEAQNDPVTITLTAPVSGDFSTCALLAEATPGRLRVAEPLPRTGPLPAGTRLSVISDDHSRPAMAVWTDAATGTIWLDQPLAAPLSAASWRNAQFPEPAATDRGRYLWLRLRLTGRGLPAPGRVGPPVAATATPVLRSLRITAPRYSLLQWLPPLFSEHDISVEPPGANFLERFLSLFEERLTEAESAADRIPRFVNPTGAPEDWLGFIAGWLDLDFDPSWPLASRRRMVIEAAALQAGRGTPSALRRCLEIYSGHPVGIVEAFRRRPPPPIRLGQRGALGIAPLGDPPCDDLLAHRFAVTVTLPGRGDIRAEMTAVRRIIDDMKPAHTDYVLRTAEAGAARIGMGTHIGATVIPGPDPGPRDRCATTINDLSETCRDAPGGFRLGGTLTATRAAEPRSQGAANVQMA